MCEVDHCVFSQRKLHNLAVRFWASALQNKNMTWCSHVHLRRLPAAGMDQDELPRWTELSFGHIQQFALHSVSSQRCTLADMSVITKAFTKDHSWQKGRCLFVVQHRRVGGARQWLCCSVVHATFAVRTFAQQFNVTQAHVKGLYAVNLTPTSIPSPTVTTIKTTISRIFHFFQLIGADFVIKLRGRQEWQNALLLASVRFWRA